MANRSRGGRGRGTTSGLSRLAAAFTLGSVLAGGPGMVGLAGRVVHDAVAPAPRPGEVRQAEDVGRDLLPLDRARVGEVARAGGAEYVVTGFVTTPAGTAARPRRHIRLAVRVTNTDSAPVRLRGEDQELTDSTGRVSVALRFDRTVGADGVAVVVVEFDIAPGSAPRVVRLRTTRSLLSARIALT
jgi:hypothetical protein